jgi:glycosyltransferase involved in cell wall biosynthesis
MKKVKLALTVHVVQRMAPGGIETLVLDLVRNGSGADRIFSLDGRADQLINHWPVLSSERRRLIAFDRKPGFHPILIAQLAAQFRRLKPQTVIVHHIGPLIYAGLAARLARVRQLVHVEHDIWQYQSGRRRITMAAFARLLRPHHVAVSQQAADALREIFPGALVSVIPPGIDTERFKPRDRAAARFRLGFDPAWLIVGSAGRLEPVKGHETLVGALREMTEPIHIAIAGDGPEKERLKVRAREHGVEDRLHLLGHRDDLEEVLPAFDVFCLPSLAEGLPRGVLEAQACGLPVVASNVGALKEAICPFTGSLVPPANPTALARALRHRLARPASRAASRSFIEDRFSWTRTLESYRNMTRAS